MKPIFHDSYPQNFFSILNQQNFAVLEKLLGSNASAVACLAPECSSNMRVLEKRKAMWVHMLINALNAGINFSDLPDGCSCDELACICGKLILEGEGVESGLVNVTATFTGVANDVAVATSDGGYSQTIASADVIASHAIGESPGYFIDFTPAGGGSVSNVTLNALTINGTEVGPVDSGIAAAPMSALPLKDLGGGAYRVFFPPLVGVDSFEVGIVLA